MSLPGFDEWLTREPREYDAEDPCPSCGRQLVDAHECGCSWQEYEAIGDGAAFPGERALQRGLNQQPASLSARDDALDPACAEGRKR